MASAAAIAAVVAASKSIQKKEGSDDSSVVTTTVSSASSTPTTTIMPTRKERNARRTRGGLLFPYKLQNLLSICTNNYNHSTSTTMTEDGKDGKETKHCTSCNESTISWYPHGRSFKVHNVAMFVSDILPLFFKQTKLKSFQRQLNLWGFVRYGAGIEEGYYYHEHFVRDQPDLVCLVKRRPGGVRKSVAGSASVLASVSALASTGMIAPRPNNQKQLLHDQPPDLVCVLKQCVPGGIQKIGPSAPAHPPPTITTCPLPPPLTKTTTTTTTTTSTNTTTENTTITTTTITTKTNICNNKINTKQDKD